MERTCPPSPCYVYDISSGKWKSFKTLIIYLNNKETELFRYDNASSDSKEIITKTISYEYIVYHSKIIPSNLVQNRQASTISSVSSKFFNRRMRPSKEETDIGIKAIITFEDLSLRYESVIQEDQYILLGFAIGSSIYAEDNGELKAIRNFIADLHVKLKYSKEGLTYQLKTRIKEILYKTVKYSLCYIAGLCNISQETSVHEKLIQLHNLCFRPAFQEYQRIMLKDPKFINEVTSLAYKTIMVVGLFPAYIELNTMDEFTILLKVKNLLANSINAPYGSQHHASFSLGNFRYSFIHDPSNKEKQRINISEEFKRGFSLRNRNFKYFRVKFFDFLPMDSWVHAIADKTLKILCIYFTKSLDIMPEMLKSYGFLKELIRVIVEQQEKLEENNSVSEKVARKFYDRYDAELDQTKNKKVFKRITRIMADAELRGYNNLSNNCQTIVSEIVSILGVHLQKIVEKTLDLNKISFSNEDKIKYLEDFLKFGSQFNNNFSDIAPFPMTCRLSYFDTFAEKDLCELLSPKNFETINRMIQEYFNRPNISKFLSKLEEDLVSHSYIHIKGSMNNPEDQKYLPDIDFSKGTDYAMVSCLMHLLNNELFNVKREIKMGKYCEIELKVMEEDQGKFKFRRRKREKWKILVGMLPELYARKYKLLEVYKEVCFYYYNTVRIGIKMKLKDSLSCLGCLIARKPD